MIKQIIAMSLKRSTATIIILFKLIDIVWLYVFTSSHYVMQLSQNGVSDAIVIAIITSHDALTWGALYIYGWAKIKGAA